MSESEKPKRFAGSKFGEEMMQDKPSAAPHFSFTEPVDTGKRKKSKRAPSSRRLSGDTVVEKRRLSGDTVVESEPAAEQDDRGESGNADSGKGQVLQNKMWFYTFLLHTVVYFGGSGYINYLSISTDKQLLTEGGQGPIDLNALYMLCGAIAIGLGSGLVAFGIATFMTEWYYWAIIGSILIASGTPIGVTIWKINATGSISYYTGMVIFGTIALLGIFYAAKPSRRNRSTLDLLVSFRELMSESRSAYWLIIIWTTIQTALEAWLTLSVAAVIIRFQPDSQACTESFCGWGIVSGIAVAFILAHFWLTATLSEVLNATLASSVFSRAAGNTFPRRSISTSLMGAGYRSLGYMARNALYSDNIESLCWPLEGVLDKVPKLNSALANCLGWYLRWLCGALEKYNKFVGIVIAIRGFDKDHVKIRSSAARYVKCGNKLEDLQNDRRNRIGRPMDPIAEQLRYEGRGAPGDERYWQHGLGAFMGSFITKSLLVSGALACGPLSTAAIYSVIIYGKPGPDISLDEWEWAIVGWSFASAYSVAYHLLMVIEAAICSIFVMIDLSSADEVAEHSQSVKTLLFAQEGFDGSLKGIWRDIPGVPDQYGRQESV